MCIGGFAQDNVCHKKKKHCIQKLCIVVGVLLPVHKVVCFATQKTDGFDTKNKIECISRI